MMFVLANQSIRDRAHEAIAFAKIGSTVSIEDPKRTLPQNRKMWAMLTEISQAAPEVNGKKARYTPDQWKAFFMNACGHEVQFMPGLSGEPFPLGCQSSKLTKEQMGELIEFMQSFAAEKGIILSEADYD